jgi:hypothetical protein
MYGISKDLTVDENNRFSGGIHNGVTIEKISYENSKEDGTGKNVLAFHFKGSKGETFRHVEFEVEQSDAKAETKVVNMSKRVKHILSKFVPEENIVINNVNSFKEYVDAIIAIAGTAYQGKTFCIKLNYGTTSYPSKYIGFPKYVGFISNDADSLKIGKDELLSPPSANPTASGNVEDFSPVSDAF